MNLADGALELPAAHLTVRVPWNDVAWDGRVCKQPGANHSCTVLSRIAEEKNSDDEERIARTPWSELDAGELPPCVLERGGFMRTSELSVVRTHPYSDWSPAHQHLSPTVHRMPAYSLEAIPFRWMMREQAALIADQWGIGYDPDLEDSADFKIRPNSERRTAWVQDHRNQIALLDTFFSAVRPDSSLVFLYAKDVPIEDESDPAARVLVGVGRVIHVDAPVEWEFTGKHVPLRSYLWERGVHHSVRPTLQDGFLLPYQELIDSPQFAGQDLGELIARAPDEHFDEYSYVTELLDDDGAIASLNELARVVSRLPDFVDGPWQQCGEWISDRLAELWELRGPYPGLGAQLAAAGVQNGHAIAHHAVEEIGEDFGQLWPTLERVIEDSKLRASPLASRIGRGSRKAWERVNADKSKYDVLKSLSRFSLSSAQARRSYERFAGSRAYELLDDPYIAYEEDLEQLDAIPLAAIDRGLFPRSTRAAKIIQEEDLGEPVAETFDDRRVRAAAIETLARASGEGHTVLDEVRVRERIAKLPLDPPCDPPGEHWDIAVEEFGDSLRSCEIANGATGWQLPNLAETTRLIATVIDELVGEQASTHQLNWREAIDELLPAIPETLNGAQLAEELAARDEKAAALDIIASSNVATIVGGAGTGKTTMLETLCANRDVAGNVLLLAPTGKARVQLGDKVGAPAQTIAQFLRGADRWDMDHGYFLDPNATRIGGMDTVIVDEASMLTEEMLAALLQTLKQPYRLVLCGDPRQLPPIGAGRPFVDLIEYVRKLTNEGSTGAGHAELFTTRRQGGGDLAISARDDLAAASCFSSDSRASGSDEALARAIAGESDETIRVVSWTDPDDLEMKLERELERSKFGLEKKTRVALAESFGATVDSGGHVKFASGEAGSGAENWQLLTPVRSRPGGVAQLNRLVRRGWRAGDSAAALRSKSFPNPFGADEVLFADKVLSTVNLPKKTYDPDTKEKASGYVANGEIGLVTGWVSDKGIHVQYSTQPGSSYTYWYSDLEGGFGDALEPLSVAYAMTIHKSQGSQFGTSFVVIPNPCPILSPELLYTALTRHRERVVLLVQGDPNDLRSLADPARSETARRLTTLFRKPDPFTSADGTLLDGSHIHRSANGELMRSKSEVIVADALREFGVEYEYEELLRMADGTVREPDFTIRRAGQTPVFWEHLGMLDLHGYRANWESKKVWYAAHGILPQDEGGGPAGTLVWSTEGVDAVGIDSQRLRTQISSLFP